MNILHNTHHRSTPFMHFGRALGHGPSLTTGFPAMTSTYQAATQSYASGFGVDLDSDGLMNRSLDGVIAFDLNQDGTISKAEIQKSKAQLELINGTAPNLRSSKSCKRASAQKQRAALIAKFDVNKDGKVSARELELKGGRALVDSNGNGTFEANEVQSLRHIRTHRGVFALNLIDPKSGKAVVSSSRPSWGGYSPF